MVARKRHARGFKWTEADIKILRDGVKRGLAAQVIAKAIGHGLSRSAICRKAQRLGLKLSGNGRRVNRPSHELASAVQAKIKGPRASEKKERRGAVRAPKIAPMPAEPVLPKPKASDVARKKIHELEREDCRWPVGDVRDPDFDYCGLPSEEGSPYCADHSARAFNNPVKRFRDARS